MINQSKAYILAHTIALNEYILEYFFIPKLEILDIPEYLLKRTTIVIGLTFILVGHFFRIADMFTAAKSFHHLV